MRRSQSVVSIGASSTKLTPIVMGLAAVLIVMNLAAAPNLSDDKLDMHSVYHGDLARHPRLPCPTLLSRRTCESNSRCTWLTETSSCSARLAEEDHKEAKDEPIPDFDIHFVTILTEPRKYHCTMLASAFHSGIGVQVFGWGDTELHGVRGWWRKILWFKGLLKTFKPDDVVVFVDAGDVLFNGGVEDIKQAYYKAVRTQNLKRENEFIWSAERHCGMKTKINCKTLHKVSSSSPYRWMNTGGWAGRADVALKIFEAVDVDRAGRTNHADQAFVAESHQNRGWRDLHGLDSEQTIFMSMYQSEKDVCGWPNPTIPLRNCATKSTPLIFHFNAGAKDAHIFNPILHKTQWWAKMESDATLEQLHAHKIVLNGKDVLLGKLCPTGFGIVEDKDVRSVKAKIDLGEAERSHITVD